MKEKIVNFEINFSNNDKNMDEFQIYINSYIQKYELSLQKILQIMFFNKEPSIEISFKKRKEKEFFIINLLFLLTEIGQEKKVTLTVTDALKNIKEKFDFYPNKENGFNKNTKLLKNKIKAKSILRKLKYLYIKNEDEQIFYDCNLPEDKEGFKLIELDQDIYKYEKIV